MTDGTTEIMGLNQGISELLEYYKFGENAKILLINAEKFEYDRIVRILGGLNAAIKDVETVLAEAKNDNAADIDIDNHIIASESRRIVSEIAYDFNLVKNRQVILKYGMTNNMYTEHGQFPTYDFYGFQYARHAVQNIESLYEVLWRMSNLLTRAYELIHKNIVEKLPEKDKVKEKEETIELPDNEEE